MSSPVATGPDSSCVNPWAIVSERKTWILFWFNHVQAPSLLHIWIYHHGYPHVLDKTPGCSILFPILFPILFAIWLWLKKCATIFLHTELLMFSTSPSSHNPAIVSSSSHLCYWIPHVHRPRPRPWQRSRSYVPPAAAALRWRPHAARQQSPGGASQWSARNWLDRPAGDPPGDSMGGKIFRHQP